MGCTSTTMMANHCNGDTVIEEDRRIVADKSNRRLPKRYSIACSTASCDTQSLEYSLGNRKYKYFGNVVKGMKHGSGQLYVEPENDLWVCDFVNDKATGPGQIYFGNGDYFEGIIQNGEMRSGKLFKKNGDVVEGQFENNIATNAVFSKKNAYTHSGSFHISSIHQSISPKKVIPTRFSAEVDRTRLSFF